MSKDPIKCAIYTRKSSEEGLEQSFNSLAAQREACRAFILSQKHEGWSVLRDIYDDGGISGGTMERPALQRLLKDIQEGKVNTVVVYKVDRLTRSLTDFAKIIEIFDSHSVSFVSVTQQFNTTSSMGRLTLNVLLSFAQFEREITGERIRDKFAASKKKGMWMGGRIPLGYSWVNSQLLVNPSEAETVRKIFRSYLSFGCLSRLKKHLDRNGIRSGIRTSTAGKKYGGAAYSRGALHHLLSNRVYIGEIVHGDKHFPGQHKPIVSNPLWSRVASRLAKNNNGRRREGPGSAPSLLTGLLFDSTGVRFTPTHSLKKGKRYRYYTSQKVIQNSDSKLQIARIPAQDLENLVVEQVRCFLKSPDRFLRQIRDLTIRAAAARQIGDLARKSAAFDRNQMCKWVRIIVSRVELGESRLWIEIRRQNLLANLHVITTNLDNPAATRDSTFKLETSFQIFRRGSSTHIVIPGGTPNASEPVWSILKAIARAKGWYDGLIRGEFKTLEDIAAKTKSTKPYVRKILQCAFISPAVTYAMLTGRHTSGLTLNKLLASVSYDWREQERSILNAS
jgi:site-specific DNA recombinase